MPQTEARVHHTPTANEATFGDVNAWPNDPFAEYDITFGTLLDHRPVRIVADGKLWIETYR